MRFILLFLLCVFTLYSAEISVTKLGRQETYMFFGSESRHSVLSFPNESVLISKYCLSKNRNHYTPRKCDAWKVFRFIEDNRFLEFRKTHPSQINDLNKVVRLVCKQSGGAINSESNEYSKNLPRELEDFCEFKDETKVPLKSIRSYLVHKSKMTLL